MNDFGPSSGRVPTHIARPTSLLRAVLILAGKYFLVKETHQKTTHRKILVRGPIPEELATSSPRYLLTQDSRLCRFLLREGAVKQQLRASVVCAGSSCPRRRDIISCCIVGRQQRDTCGQGSLTIWRFQVYGFAVSRFEILYVLRFSVWGS